MRFPVRRLVPLLALALCASSGVLCPSPASAASATDDLLVLDKRLYSGFLDVSVDRFPAPDKNGKRGAPERTPAQLLFERPDRFRMTLHPGAWNEFRAVGEAGVVRWLDLATGLSGKDATEKAIDPLAAWLLGTVGEMTRFGTAEDLPAASSKSGAYGARLAPDTFGTDVSAAIAWFANGTPTGLELRFVDGSSMFVSVLRFERNVKTSAGDFQL